MAQEQKNMQEPDLNQLRKVRREKLAELQQSGRDPFVITKYDQTRSEERRVGKECRSRWSPYH